MTPEWANDAICGPVRCLLKTKTGELARYSLVVTATDLKVLSSNSGKIKTEVSLEGTHAKTLPKEERPIPAAL